jgi:hypothetical protein
MQACRIRRLLKICSPRTHKQTRCDWLGTKSFDVWPVRGLRPPDSRSPELRFALFGILCLNRTTHFPECSLLCEFWLPASCWESEWSEFCSASSKGKPCRPLWNPGNTWIMSCVYKAFSNEAFKTERICAKSPPCTNCVRVA